MGFRFRKSIKIAPGVKLNFNKKSTGITFGGKGVHYTINSKGKRTASIGIPGTGISFSESFGGKMKKKAQTEFSDTNYFEDKEEDKVEKKKSKKGCLPIAIIGFVIVGVIGLIGSGGDDIAETTTEITSLVETVLSTDYTTKPVYTTIPETTYLATTTDAPTTETTTLTTTEATAETTTSKPTTTTQKSTTTTTQKATTTTQKATTTTKKATTTQKATTTTKKATTTKATTTKKVTTTQKPTTTKKVTTTAKPTTTKKVTTTKKPTTTKKVTTTKKPNSGKTDGKTVYVTPSGKRWHLDPDCPGKNGYAVSIDEVGSRTPCQKCAQ